MVDFFCFSSLDGKVQGFISVNIRNFFQRAFFLFFGLGLRKLHFLKYKKLFRVSVSWNIKNFWGVSDSWNIRKYKKFFNNRARKFHFPKYKNFFSRWRFSIFFGLGFRKCARWPLIPLLPLVIALFTVVIIFILCARRSRLCFTVDKRKKTLICYFYHFLPGLHPPK